MNSKKSNIIVLSFSFMIWSMLAIVIIMMFYLLFAVGNDYMILPLYNATTNLNFSQNVTTQFENTVTNYQNIDLSYVDDTWFVVYLIVSMMGFFLAYKSRTTNYFSWLSMLTYGMMLILFLGGLFLTVMDVLYNQILLNLFDNLIINLPKLEYFLNNYGFILMLQSGVMLLVNVLDFDISFIKGRKDKEISSLEEDDEVV